MNLSDESLRLSELLVTKLCHDLSGSVGAVANGTELLQSGGENVRQDSLKLVEQSALASVARIKFFRQAYGDSKDGLNKNFSVTKTIIEEYFMLKKLEINWLGKSDGASVEHFIEKVLMNILSLASDIMIFGAKAFVSVDSLVQSKVTVEVHGRAHMETFNDYKNFISGHDRGEIGVTNAQLYFASQLVKKNSLNLAIKHEDEVLRVEAL